MIQISKEKKRQFHDKIHTWSTNTTIFIQLLTSKPKSQTDIIMSRSKFLLFITSFTAGKSIFTSSPVLTLTKHTSLIPVKHTHIYLYIIYSGSVNCDPVMIQPINTFVKK